MPIPYFSGHQDDVFFPAYALLLVAAVAVGLPLMFWPGLRRMRARPAILVVAGLVAAASVLGAVALAAPGFGKIGAQYTALRADVRSRYGIALTNDQAQSLVGGDSIELPPVTTGTQKVLLKQVAGERGYYYLDLSGVGEVTPRR